MNTFYLQTPFSALRLDCTEQALVGVEYVARTGRQGPADRLQRRIARQIEDYCRSGQSVFDLPMDIEGTAFQQRVWAALQAIPAGEVRTYGDIARLLKSSPRAVGNACHANPIPLIIPCHRVVAASGIGGFSGATSGPRVNLKRRLLAHEGVEI